MTAIRLKHVHKQYRTGIRALKDLSLDLDTGGIVGLLGPNGSGKSTLLKILAGAIQAYQGEVLVFGSPLLPSDKGRIAYLPDQNFLASHWTVDEAVSLFGDFFADFDQASISKLLAQFQLQKQRRVGELSKGMRRKLEIALTMSRKAKIYLLDEPLSGVDPASRAVILEGILQSYADDALLLLSTHLVADIESVINQVILLKDGAIHLQGEAESLRADHGQSLDQLFREVFSC